MAHKSTFEAKFRRRREGRTDYKKRLALLKSKKPRLVVRKSNKRVIVQGILFDPKGDRVISEAQSNELRQFNWGYCKKNTPSAYLTGLLAGLKLKKKNAKEMVLDIGLVTPVHGSVVFAALKGAIDAGLSIKANEKALPSIERIQGNHIQDFAFSLEQKRFEKVFSESIKNKSDPKKIMEEFNKTKELILKKFGEKSGEQK